MNLTRSIRNRRNQSGVALLISIFVLLLICVVAIALVVASGTESALSGNYRSATSVYYAALAGLEEGRGRLLPRNPDYYLKTKPNFLPPPGTALSIGQVRYIVNPVGGEDVLATYPDLEYDKEFGSGALAAATVQSINSVSAVAGIQGPLYKWVRISATTEQSMNLDIDSSGTLDNTTPVYYDGAHLNLSSSGAQVLEITSLAVLPNGTQKILQYLVAPNPTISLPPFPAAVTLVGNNVDYTGPDSSSWNVSGNDNITLGSCSPPSGAAVYAVGYSNNSDGSKNNINAGSFTTYWSNYTGLGAAPGQGSLGYIGGSIPASLQKPSGLEKIVQSVTQNADFILQPTTPPPPGTIPTFHGNPDLPSGMSPTNPMTIVVQGNLDLTSWHNTGYGLLLVTGNLIYDPDASWYGIVLVIGQGAMTGSHMGSGQFVGAIFVAQSRDSSGNVYSSPDLLPPPAGSPPGTFGSNIELPTSHGGSMGGNGVFYSSCWIKAATPMGVYQTLSFHEISQ